VRGRFAKQLCFGGDYNPEQWPEQVWAQDADLMRRAGVNLVSVGIFAWSRLEPREGEYDFGWLDRVLDGLHAGGIAVALATPTASPPPWFTFAYPDALPVTKDGVRLVHGSRDAYCASAPAYRAAAARIATALAQRYADHQALALWHVHNEYGTWCHCDHVAAAFRHWLRERYGSLDRLNEAWTTSFWSQHYTDWEHIQPPRATQYLANPAQLLDFRRCLSDELLTCFTEQRDILRRATPAVPVTTNFVFGAWVPVDPWVWAREVDIVAIDHYPASVKDLDAEAETAFAADLARGWAGGQPWLLMEQAPAVVHMGGRMVPKRPGQLTRLSLSHVARGSVGAMFFQWRASRGGPEAFHPGMVPHAGPDAHPYPEVVELGAQLAREERDDSRVLADVALVWDPESWWARQGPGLPAPDLDYWDAVQTVHASAWRLGVTADVVAPGAPLSAYRLVLVPGLFVVSDATAAAVQSFVESGGHAVVWYLSGVVDPYARVHLGGFPGPLRTVLGVRVDAHHPLAPGPGVRLSSGAGASHWSERVRLDGASMVASYADGDLAGEPAITRHRFGEGDAWYVSTRLDPADLDAFLGEVATAAGVGPAAAGAGGGVEVVPRASGRLFAINHTEAPAEIEIGSTRHWLAPGTTLIAP
jgi:beta-galactosidase